jgi:hypothetical protein
MVEIRKVLPLVFSMLWLTPSHAADLPAPKFTEEFSRQERIYRGEVEQAVEGYTVDRSLAVYADALASGFDRELATLGPGDRWLDIGAGKAQAILDYYAPSYDLTHAAGAQRSGSKAQAIAMSIEDRRTPLWHQTAARLPFNQIQYLADKRLRNYSLEELGQFQLITDVIGGFSYTADLSLFMEQTLGYLKVNGSFYTALQDIHFEDGKNRPYYQGSPFLTELRNADGTELKVCAWLKRIACAEVTCESRADWQPPLEAFRIRKVCNEVKVPALDPLQYKAGTPPERRFQVRN